MLRIRFFLYSNVTVDQQKTLYRSDIFFRQKSTNVFLSSELSEFRGGVYIGTLFMIWFVEIELSDQNKWAKVLTFSAGNFDFNSFVFKKC